MGFVCSSEEGCFQLFCPLRTLGLPALVPAPFQSHAGPMPSSSLTTTEISENAGMLHLGILISISLFCSSKTAFLSPNLQSVLVSPQTSFCQCYSPALTLSLCLWGPHPIPCALLSIVSFHTHSPTSSLSMAMPTAWTYGTSCCPQALPPIPLPGFLVCWVLPRQTWGQTF